ncbi:CDP-glycerol glycerophosphotransferase family protein [Streptomyces sp. H10-C2]|uniref:bifunctional glycosyltransferase/CDP-glycerol:glycerophosphate glycerophosphotransferase n=1 Tax=unclassified Streptomyces TaxID=2593676 RepID=UPI0024BB794D|nr:MULTISPECIES: bifunctional glycosyltransferase/CDP-glycerol:glycerophosphate glycerophosphotransferase [unclassified Streptomyces]MDJ0345718.1 CDP-glycerol glycerophosphotransferase family protein [Streptomyces sp. PH10-H1]MDJ0374589.1 CDP-glycerol glycerophosphotransferase family protein [Streptomyces sp. H10-C2]
MPRFSVIVPAYKVQAYLHACLASVLTQSFTDFELIVVNDGSPDGSGEIIDEFAGRDHRITAIHLPENVGPGHARNAGLSRATGDYLLFLDSDDTLAPGSLRAIADRVKETGGPDLLVYDYERTYWNGDARRNRFAGLLAQSGPAAFVLDDRPELLRLLTVVWNKAYRREFVERRGLSFPPGYYEATPWTHEALLAAGSIAVLDRVCVHYRQRRRGNILATTSRRHFDIFKQYDRVFAFLDSHPELERWRPVLFGRMLDHLTAVYNVPGRLPRSARADYFKRCRSYYRRHRPRKYRAPLGGRSGLRCLLVRLGARRTFRALGAVHRLRLRSQARATAGCGRIREAALRLHYRLQRRRALDPDLAVFSAYRDRGYVCNPAAIEARLRELAPHIRTAWVTTLEHAHTLPPGVRRLQPGSAAYWTALARAKYLVSNAEFDHRYTKRAGQLNLQTHHGTPLKHMGLDLREFPAAARGTDFEQLLQHVDRWDYSLSSNRHSSLTWERAYPSGFTTLEYGQPRNDIFQRATTEDILRIRAELGIPRDSTAVLYAPTHRDYRGGYRPELDVDRMARELGPGFTVLMRTHHLYDTGAQHAAGQPAFLDVSRHPSVEQLCLASDVLLTDYSSLMFDYANLDRPIVIHAEDWEVYRASRGAYFDITAQPPGLVARSEDELTDILATDAWRGPRSAQLRAAFRERFCPYDDGNAAERVVRRLFLEDHRGLRGLPEDTLPSVIPLEDRRPAPAPGQARALSSRPHTGTLSVSASLASSDH